MSLKTLGILAIVGALIVAGVLVMHGDHGGVVHDWLRSLHGQR
jgi:hypothetical protein